MSGQPIVREALVADAVLGESPVWSPARQRLLWVDTEGRRPHAFDPASGHNQSTAMPDVVGMVAEDRDGRLTVALGCGLARLGASPQPSLSARRHTPRPASASTTASSTDRAASGSG